MAEDVIGGDLGVSRNTLREAFQREILGRVETGDGPGGERLLADYLDRAREQLVGAHAQQTATGK